MFSLTDGTEESAEDPKSLNTGKVFCWPTSVVSAQLTQLNVFPECLLTALGLALSTNSYFQQSHLFTN